MCIRLNSFGPVSAFHERTFQVPNLHAWGVLSKKEQHFWVSVSVLLGRFAGRQELVTQVTIQAIPLIDIIFLPFTLSPMIQIHTYPPIIALRLRNTGWSTD